MADAGTFDYVVVGAGSAGCVLADRLTAAGRSVLVLEAGGPDDRREIHVPAAFPRLFKSAVDWDFTTAPQDAMGGRELYWPRGKTLGGSSAINAMIYMRGHPRDYDEWAAAGNEGWGWDDLLPYFRRAEANGRGASEYHGGDGPLSVVDLARPHELTGAFVAAGEAVGLPHNPDFNDGDQHGVGRFQVTQQGGERHSAADAYLKPALGRAELRAETGARVTRVLFEDGAGGDPRAAGVAFRQDGERHTATAEREVIVSAGAVNSPHLLMCSGVGPADHLREHGVAVRADSPGVGRNLQDHLVCGVVYEATGTETLDDAAGLLNLARQQVFGSGPLTSNGAEAGGFAYSGVGDGDGDDGRPDLQFHFIPSYYMRHTLDNPEEGQGFTIGATQLRPESRGEIRLASADPLADPVIDPGYCAVERDVDVLVAGVRRARAIAQADPFDPYRGAEVSPGIDTTDDADLAAYVRGAATTIYHPVGTCRMGPADDETAVVDDHLRVYGVEGLRVVDASVMPTLVGGNTNAPTIAIAEQAADLVLRN